MAITFERIRLRCPHCRKDDPAETTFRSTAPDIQKCEWCDQYYGVQQTGAIIRYFVLTEVATQKKEVISYANE